LVLRDELAGRRGEVVARLQRGGIECRPIVAGNFTTNPVIDHLDHSIHGSLENAKVVDTDGLFVGNHHYPLIDEIDHLRAVLDELVR
jgi:CDP-6-deoxy-D-xylo-4-hexulose-3-dehydrase